MKQPLYFALQAFFFFENALAFLDGEPFMCGTLFLEGDEQIPLSLRAINTHVTVRGWASIIESELSYVNSLEKPIECEFVFPMMDTSAVYKLEARMGNRTITGQVQEKSKANETFQ